MVPDFAFGFLRRARGVSQDLVPQEVGEAKRGGRGSARPQR